MVPSFATNVEAFLERNILAVSNNVIWRFQKELNSIDEALVILKKKFYHHTGLWGE